jgi:hypothetical protein
MAFCGALVHRGALQPAIAVLLLLSVPATADGSGPRPQAARVPALSEAIRRPPRAIRVADQFVLLIPRESIDPGDRRPR